MDHNKLTLLENELQRSITSFTRILSAIVNLLVNNTIALNHVSGEINNMFLGIQMLVQGYISPNLIRPSTLKYCIEQIKSQLHETHPAFHLVHGDVQFYYTSKLFMYTRDQNSIYISMKFPISVDKHLFQVYQVQTFPHMVEESSNHSTQLLDYSAYFAVSKTPKHFLELTTAQYHKCSGNMDKHCSTILTRQTIEIHPSDTTIL